MNLRRIKEDPQFWRELTPMHPANVGIRIENKAQLEAAKTAFGDVEDDLVAGEIMNALWVFKSGLH